MKYKNFNKFGGTEFRVKDQISAYVFLINWILKFQEENSFSKKDIVEEAFRNFCTDEDIYEYRRSDKIKDRFKMVLQNLTKDLHILHFDENTKKYKLDEKFSIKNPQDSFLFFMQNAWKEFDFPFKRMLEFMYKNKNLNDAKKLLHAFMVYDGKEPFEYLYKIDVINKILDDEFKYVVPTDDLWKIIKFRKPTKNHSLIERIYWKKYKGLEILENDLTNFKKNDKYLKQIIFGDKQNTRFTDIKIFIRNLNEIDTITFLRRLRRTQLNQTFNHEYCDLFNRWMYGIGLATSSSTKEKIYLSNRVDFKNGNYIVNIPHKPICFPFTMHECMENLKKIQEEKYYDVKSSLSLGFVPNSAIAEYFVNLFFCYKLGIQPAEFRKYVNTKIDDKLKPVFNAPGGVPDMWYKKNNHIYCIETTIMKNDSQIYRSEPEPSTRHLCKIINEYKVNFSNNHLYFISYKCDEHLKDICDVFWKTYLKKRGIDHCKLNFKNYSFEDLSTNEWNKLNFLLS